MIHSAVILAAGMGSRLCRVLGCTCKQVVRIHSLELIMYPLVSLWRSGIKHFVVVTNPANYHLIDNVLQRYSDLMDITYKLEINPYIDTGNGNSALIGLKRFKNPVILSVSDHIYPPIMPSKLLECINKEADIIVLGDPKPVLVDAGEATKIAVEKDMVLSASKNLKQYDYIDTGIFIFKRPDRVVALFESSKPLKLAEIVSSKKIVSRVCEVNGAIWKDIDVFEDLEYVYNTELKKVVKDLVGALVSVYRRKYS